MWSLSIALAARASRRKRAATSSLSASDDYSVFAEPGIVEASDDGVNFKTFPYDAGALAQVTSLCTAKSQIQQLVGLMGITPNFTGNYTVPDDPLVFDATAPGGVSGHGGDAFAPVAHLAVEDVLVASHRGRARVRRAVMQHPRHVLVREHRLDAGKFQSF